MKLSWSELPAVAKWCSSLSAIAAFMFGAWISVAAAYEHFQTDAEAEAAMNGIENEFHSYQQQKFDSDKAQRIDGVEERVSDIEYQLLSERLSPEQREFLNGQMDQLLDTKKCIQADDC